jgi:LPPG:FO 2-phospho-L-lactate transferase
MAVRVVALAGGVGGARLAQGLCQAMAPESLTVIVNTGDDFEYLGLNISPDLDTVCYTLAGMADPVNGWGLADDTFLVMEHLKLLGCDAWFGLGDRDLGTHLARTHYLKSGQLLSEITRDFCKHWEIKAAILPMTDGAVRTKVLTKQDQLLDFQEYFVHQKCKPEVKGFRFDGIENAVPTQDSVKAIKESDLVIICPSNPWVSIDPILSIMPIRKALMDKRVVAVSPLIGGKAIKGPLSKMYMELGIKPSCLAIAEHYRELVHGILIDHIDSHEKESIEAFGIIALTTDILMRDANDRKRLAEETLKFGKSLSIIP